MEIITFGAVTLPEGQDGYECNFATAKGSILSLASSSGGYDTFGTSRGVTPVGLVGKTFLVFGDTPTAYQTAIDAFQSMQALGAATLAASWDDATTTRQCTARVFTLDRVASGRLYGEYRVVWEVAYPRWESATLTTTNITASGTSTDTTIANAGNAYALPVITLTCAGGQTALDPTFRIMDGSTILDEAAYDGTITNASGALVLNCQTKAVTLNGVAVYSPDITRLFPDMIRLRSGNNTFRVVMGGGGNAATVVVTHRATFY